MSAETPAPETGPEVALCREEILREIQAILEASPEAAAWSAATLQDTFKTHGSYFLVGRHREEIAGFISGRKVADEAEILNLAVQPRHRRHGIGRALVTALLEIFAREGAVQVFLEVRQSNLSAIGFYQNLGFHPAGRREAYYRSPEEAALVLSLTTVARSGT